jgi:hypothetical protein
MNLELLGHEWTHAVFNTDVNQELFDTGEQDGLDEATADFFGKLISMRGAGSSGSDELPRSFVRSSSAANRRNSKHCGRLGNSK